SSSDQYPILSALWVYRRGTAPPAQDLITGRHEMRPLGFLDCGGAAAAPAAPAGPPRGDLMLVSAGRPGRIRVTIDSELALFADRDRRGIFRGGVRFLSASSPWEAQTVEEERIVLEFPETVADLALYCASGHDAGNVELDWARSQVERSRLYWAGADFPYGKIAVPDENLQRLLDGAVRNIYQAREVQGGLPVFQVGPTCYRGLWVVDGAFILEAMTYLDRVDEVRAGIRHLLSRAKPDGSFELLESYWKENGIVLYIIYRHALLTQDLPWLMEHWHVLQTLVRVIRGLRVLSRADPSAPEAGLLPPGFPDGGIGGRHAEYTNVYWTLAGLRSAAEAARLLGEDTLETSSWQAEYEDFLETFRRAAQRDLQRSDDGSPYLPILMRPQEGIHPVRGQWGFCHAVHPGQVFEPDDPLVLGNLALLDSRESQGLVLGTGWMADGIWTYFASFYGHAHLWVGHGEKAARILYAFANHASPLLAWREEQHPDGKGSGLVGDMPHNWASAEFIRLARNLLALERGDELHLLEGIPRTWLRPGAVTALDGIRTDFGRLKLRLEISPGGESAQLSFEPPRERPARRIVVHLGAWSAADPEPAFVSADGRLLRFKIPLR
ncbi:MAG: hypothetical protein JXA90_06495, partial [Planctomycetes bacterium]|nr:hypothetical protein [Planctomycetota bacterium]